MLNPSELGEEIRTYLVGIHSVLCGQDARLLGRFDEAMAEGVGGEKRVRTGVVGPIGRKEPKGRIDHFEVTVAGEHNRHLAPLPPDVKVDRASYVGDGVERIEWIVVPACEHAFEIECGGDRPQVADAVELRAREEDRQCSISLKPTMELLDDDLGVSGRAGVDERCVPIFQQKVGIGGLPAGGRCVDPACGAIGADVAAEDDEPPVCELVGVSHERFARRRCHAAGGVGRGNVCDKVNVMPPSTVRIAPETYDESGPARKVTTPATSSVDAMWRSGTRCSRSRMMSSAPNDDDIGVLMNPGLIAFARTPCGPHSGAV